MSRDRRDEHFGQHYLRGLGLSTRKNALAYGYSIVITAGFGVVEHFRGRPTIAEIYLFLVGAAAPFAVLNAALTRGFRQRVEDEPPVVMALGTALSLFSITGASGLTTLVAWRAGGWLPWLLAPAVATAGYLLLAGLEIATARRVHHAVGTENLEDR